MLKPKQKIPSTDFENQVYHGDSQQMLKSLPDNSVDLIITSPPYANQRSKSYGGIKASEYVEWFIPIAVETTVEGESIEEFCAAVLFSVCNSCSVSRKERSNLINQRKFAFERSRTSVKIGSFIIVTACSAR